MLHCLNGKSKNDVRILFVNPCLRKNGNTKLLPVGLGYIMTYFRQNGYKFSLLDIDINEYSDSYIENYISKNEYDFVLLGTIVTHYKWVKWFVNMTKNQKPQTNVIVGNSVAGSIPEIFFDHTKCDVAVIGEGEITAFEAVEAIRLDKKLENVEGIAFKDVNGKFIQNPPRKASMIDDLPMIEWDFFDVEKYIKKSATYYPGSKTRRMRSMPVATARGCAFKCTFCHYVFWNDPYRNRSPENILLEVKRNSEKYNANYMQFWDDLSFASAKQAERLADAIIKSGLKFYWNASVRVDLFSRSKLSDKRKLEVAEKMKKSGCLSVGFSLESGNKEILKMMNKEIDAEAFAVTINAFKKAGIVTNTSVVFGYPIETSETIKETFDQCLKAKVYPSIGFLLPLPYTAMYDYAKANGFITDEDKYLDSITERQDICMNMTKMSDSEIMDGIKIGAKQLNEMLQLHLTEATYIRTKRYQNDAGMGLPDSKSKKKLPLDPDNIKRNENDVSFNYSETEFEIDAGEIAA